MLVLVLSQSGQTQNFEVASVKPADPNSPGTMINYPNRSTFRATGITVRNGITLAFQIQPFQLAGGPGLTSATISTPRCLRTITAARVRRSAWSG
jgi:hypothetical protein